VNKLDKAALNFLEKELADIQKNIEKKLANLNNKNLSKLPEAWKRKEGGGGKSISISGDVIEKAAVNFSSIYGKKLPASSIGSIYSNIHQPSGFHALGVSAISHPANPFCPTSHMNIRIFFELSKNKSIKNWWIGGGFDLTPFFESTNDASFWHLAAKRTLDRFNKNYYKRFAKACDEYFYLPHRDEKRGIGGIFFDQLQHKDIQSSMKLLKEIAECYIDTYKIIIGKRKTKKFNALDRDFQLYRRSRYVEFNLLFDRGTKFGIDSNGRADSILASLPPAVNWPYPKPSPLVNREKKLLKFLDKSWNERI
jgi:coproporphyrinogen III oxidase